MCSLAVDQGAIPLCSAASRTVSPCAVSAGLPASGVAAAGSMMPGASGIELPALAMPPPTSTGVRAPQPVRAGVHSQEIRRYMLGLIPQSRGHGKNLRQDLFRLAGVTTSPNRLTKKDTVKLWALLVKLVDRDGHTLIPREVIEAVRIDTRNSAFTMPMEVQMSTFRLHPDDLWEGTFCTADVEQLKSRC